MKRIILLFLLSLTCSTVFAQEIITVKGVVTDAKNQPMPGATVTEKGTSNKVIAANNGSYQIKAKNNATLVFTYLGTKAVEMPVNKANTVNAILLDDNDNLNEVVVIGYGISDKRGNIPGAVSSISGAELAKVPVQNVAMALQGRISGMQVTMNDGTPGGEPKIVIRGGTSISGSNEPLYVVDGVPQEGGLNFLDPMDIESVDVLKDASASAIYGSRGANGVVLVTTKKLKSGKMAFNYDTYMGFKKLNTPLEVLNAYEFALLQYERSVKDVNKTANFVKTYGAFADLQQNFGNRGVNWQDQVMGKTVKNQYHKFSLSGGSAETQFNLFFSNNTDEGVLQGSGANKNVGKFTFSHNLNNKLRVNAIINYSNLKTTGIGVQNTGSRFNLIQTLLQYRPIFGLDFADEDLLEIDQDPIFMGQTTPAVSPQNPIRLIETTPKETRDRQLNVNASVDYTFLKNLSYRGLISYYTRDIKGKSFTSAENILSIRNGGASGSLNQSVGTGWSYNNSVTYNNVFNKKHKLSATLGQEQVYDYIEALGVSASQFPELNLGWDNFGFATLSSIPSSSASDATLFSLFSRANYTYDDKYIFAASLRADGSSKFAPGNQWGYFPSASFSWKITQEEFMKKFPVVSDLRLRLSVGQSGNNRIGNNLSDATFGLSNYPIGGVVTRSAAQNNIANPDLKWESVQTKNLGLDIGLYNQRISLTTELYDNRSVDLLFTTPISSTSGFSTMQKNVGTTGSRGIELTLNTTNIRNKNFSWSSSFNIAFNRTKVIALNQGQTQLIISSYYSAVQDFILQVGNSVGNVYGYKQDGVYQVKDFDYNAVTNIYTLKSDVLKDPDGGTLVPGSIKYKDMNGDNVINSSDRSVIGQTAPRTFGGINNNFTYKNFDLSIFCNFTSGNDIYNATKIVSSGNVRVDQVNALKSYKDRWTTINAAGQYVKNPLELEALNLGKTIPSIEAIVGDGRAYSTVIEDGSFFRINTISLGYSLPKKWLNSVGLSRARIYFTAYNIYVFTKYTGYDPEVSVANNSGLTPGVDSGAYPRSKSYLAGLNVSF